MDRQDCQEPFHSQFSLRLPAERSLAAGAQGGDIAAQNLLTHKLWGLS
jgi:hypothetical protein